MFRKSIFAPLFILILGACAQPKYVHADNPSDGNGPLETQAECSNSFKASGLCLSWAWEVKPTDSTKGSLTFKVYRLNALDNTAVLVDLQDEVKVVLWMPSMGHGSSPTTVEKVDTGTYRANDVFFVMPGEWEIKFQTYQGSALSDESVVSLSI